MYSQWTRALITAMGCPLQNPELGECSLGFKVAWPANLFSHWAQCTNKAGLTACLCHLSAP